MALNADHLRRILGLKLRSLRSEQQLGLKELSKLTGVSVSYLSEIEKGKKFPKPDKLLQLADALGVSYEDLVSPNVEGPLAPLQEILESPFLREFPFAQYGLDPDAVFGLLSGAPSLGKKTEALVHTALEIGRGYNMEVEHFLRAALRSYQLLHANYFSDVEEAARRFRDEQGWPKEHVPSFDELRDYLSRVHGYATDVDELARSEELRGLRAVTVDGKAPRLLINGRLSPSQQAFMVGREIGYRRLGLSERSMVSPPLEATSYNQVIDDFMSAYFSGAVLIGEEALNADVEALLQRRQWSDEGFLSILERYGVTPETFFYRLSQLLPAAFGMRKLFFLRFSYDVDSGRLVLTKVLNMSPLKFPIGVHQREHFCRRWPGLSILSELQRRPGAVEPEASPEPPVRLRVQRSRFIQDDEEYLVVTLSRPLSLAVGVHTSISLGWHLDPAARRRMAFVEDPDIPRQDVHLSCERCPLSESQCAERAAPPTLLDATRNRQALEVQLASLRSTDG